ncbi:MAG TPA: methyltransferase domain-containing protein [Thermoanaerobaculia bacterium]|nr:methyltransferase domain-containing protein [Thermoanaerobaculia bacterium]
MKSCLACRRTWEAAGWICPQCGWKPAAIDGFLAFAPELSADHEGFDNKFFEQLAAIEPESFWFRNRNALIIWALRTYFPRAKRLLEIGCGTGFVLQGIHRALPEGELFGSEVLIAGLPFARARVPAAELYQMDARRIPFDSDLDVAGAFDVIEHIEDDEVVLREMLRAVRPGGGIVLTVPQHRFLWGVTDEVAHHRRRYARSELVMKVRSAGFEVVRATSFVATILPLMLVSRWRQRGVTAEEFDEMAEHNIPRWMDHMLRVPVAVERGLIRAGISLPFGGSLLLVGRRPGA